MIFITGSSGFIGSNFVKHFHDKKVKFKGLDKKINPYFKSKHLIKINLLNRKKLFNIFKNKKPNLVIHLAADSGLNFCHMNQKDAFKNNVEATFNILLACKKYNCKNIVAASSMAAEKYNSIPSFYGFTKMSTENLFKTFNKIYGLNSSILRFSNIFGPYSKHKTSAIHKMIQCIFKKNEIFKIHGTGKQKRDFVYSVDLVAETLKICSKKRKKLIYEVNSKKKYSINQVFTLIKGLSKMNIKSIKIKAPKGYDVTFDKTKNFKIEKNFLNNLNNTIKWYKKNS